MRETYFTINLQEELNAIRECSSHISKIIHAEQYKDNNEEREALISAYVMLREELEDAGIFIICETEELFANYLTLRTLVRLKRTFSRTNLTNIFKTNDVLLEGVKEYIQNSIDDAEDPDELELDHTYDLLNDIVTLLRSNYSLNEDYKDLSYSAMMIGNTDTFRAYIQHIIDEIVKDGIEPEINDFNREAFMKYLKAFGDNHAMLEQMIRTFSIQHKDHEWSRVRNIFRNYHIEKYQGPESPAWMSLYDQDINELPDLEKEHRLNSKHHIEYWLKLNETMEDPYFIMLMFALIDDARFDEDLITGLYEDMVKHNLFTSEQIDLGTLIINYNYQGVIEEY